MNQSSLLRLVVKSLILIGLALGYAFLVGGPGTLTESAQGDGTIGVVLGLFICSQPAAYIVGLFYRSRGQSASGSRWLEPTLQILTFLAGVSVVVMGTIQLAQTTPAH